MATRIRPEEKQASLLMEGAEAPIRAEGFNHLHINVRDLARSMRFYGEAFGEIRPDCNARITVNKC
jgi:catechol-2,3-dioxygenase